MVLRGREGFHMFDSALSQEEREKEMTIPGVSVGLQDCSRQDSRQKHRGCRTLWVTRCSFVWGTVGQRPEK